MITMTGVSLAMGLLGGCGDKDEPREDFECVDYSGQDCASVGLPEENLRAVCGDCSELWYCSGSDSRGYEVAQSRQFCYCITEDGYLDNTPGGPCDDSDDSPD